jgi:hypothetical protein
VRHAGVAPWMLGAAGTHLDAHLIVLAVAVSIALVGLWAAPPRSPGPQFVKSAAMRLAHR